MKVLVGMSGGVDSSVAAILLKQAGHEVIGATMSIWDNNDNFRKLTGKGCFSPHDEDISQAQQICKTLNIPHLVIDCTEQYKKIVMANFRSEYLAGRTPNPCIVCNSKIKFTVLPESARRQGVSFDKFATGHYARLSFNQATGFYQILKGLDLKKDQSYFLYRLSQEQLSQILLPLGNKNKDEIRQLAKQEGLSIYDKPDSQDFYTGELNDILQFPPQTGKFINRNGKVLGFHKGYWNFTIGQRRGLGISADKPLYVIDINKNLNEVIVGYIDECQQTSLIAENWIWQSPQPSSPIHCQARIRSSQHPIDAELIPISKTQYKVKFSDTQKAITPGQSIVIYNNDAILGGGIIEKI